MHPTASTWTLVLLERGERKRVWPLPPGLSHLGRDSSNGIRLAHSSVSRRHAELRCGAEGLFITDLKSHNGVIVNGVPRLKAALQAGDHVSIGAFELEVAAGSPITTAAAPAAASQGMECKSAQTLDQPVQLPKEERGLYSLYHVCSWLTDEVEEKEFIPKCLRLLREAVQAEEAQFYSAEGRLEAFDAEGRGKPTVKLAAFLVKHFQASPEAVVIPGTSLATHQQRVGEFNYLVGPLRSGLDASATPGAPFVALLRPLEWKPFTGTDRLLLQAICQLWVRGRARVVQVRALRRENAELKGKVRTPELLGASPAMEKLRERVCRVAATNVTVLLRGETGSGKEVVAHLIHEQSARREGPFVKVNCAAIPDSLIESELFGHVKGAFTGADKDRPGKFAQADQGTLFLDEIGEMPLSIQAKVLRALENGEIEPLGSESTTHVNVRLIAATHCDLGEMVRQKQFRPDLFYRLNVMQVVNPPLRDHLADVDTLAVHFLRRFCEENGLAEINFTQEALEEMKRQAWPGNVRQLRNVVQGCAASAESSQITADQVREQILASV